MIAIKEKMELVQATFRKGKEMAERNNNLEELNKLLLRFPNEFISVAYEGASMAIALNSIKTSNNLIHWKSFYEKFSLQHAAQIHVGLGWALSELNLSVNDLDLEIHPFLTCRILDGYGYYEGLFKRRQSIRTQQVPTHLNKLELKAYNQGLGRSLWYISQGEIEKLTKLILST